ncbi:hypothetical protein TNIN_316491 [Trichonephila inaurata madagascariensis]|uniref:Uncharacterized protein n=1 Tax=Trichonephila inaurata madagascariensis TaxID=2747483 RepID=A0A8X6JEJ4_9ARAC|nr:hypothetical protein TNIN_316491 [Trichonephila inaurata madagascariensis]
MHISLHLSNLLSFIAAADTTKDKFGLKDAGLTHKRMFQRRIQMRFLLRNGQLSPLSRPWQKPWKNRCTSFLCVCEDPEEKKLTNPKALKAEFSLFEATNERTKDLDLLFDALKAIKRSSVASERVSSISGNIVSKIILFSRGRQRGGPLYPIVERRENGEEFITEMSFSIIFHRLSDFSPTSFEGVGTRGFTTAPNASSFRQKALEGGGEDYEPRATGDSPSLEVSPDDGNNLFRRGLTIPHRY